jgi:hypothetical protein
LGNIIAPIFVTLGKEVRLKGFELGVCGILFGAIGGILEEAKKALVDNAMEN